ncbi:bifunctional oligoribonuclease/PAP phosphatase NrnA [soil metagenome]|nr:bifunctional oligoribonuclease/PAP phosphatase NrnA [Gemmatimonadota bacterium]
MSDPRALPVGTVPVPEHRAADLREVRERLLGAKRVVLTTHLNADGDGAGSEAAVAAWLAEQGVASVIVNPTRFPLQFRFLLDPSTRVADWGGMEAVQAIDNADLLLVLDTSEPERIGPLASVLPRERMLVVDHHPPGSKTVADVGLLDPTAAAVGELVYDLLSLDGDPPPQASLLGIYVALVTDTGSFRYSNTTARTHAIASDLLARGIDPEAVYQRLFATVPRRRIELLREVLGTLQTERESGLAWMVVSHALISRVGASGEDLDNLIEHARSLEGTEVALLFRETPEGHTKISFRSNGAADVNRLAREFGGGGHVKAAGALIPARPAEAAPRVLAVARAIIAGGLRR